MKDYKYLISVIIPTRNRQTYAAAAVRHICKIDDRIQIIVQDNSDDMTLKDMIDDIEVRDNVIYNYVEKRIAGIDNYNMAAMNAQGKYFIALGDDDTLLPNVIRCAEWMEANNFDAVKPLREIQYWWPDSNSCEQRKRVGFIKLGECSDKINICDTEEGIKKLLSAGGQGYSKLPVIGSYHCLIKTERMRQVFEITGRYYGGLSPDMYSVACLSLLPNMRAVEIGYPISIPGVCPSSTSAMSAKKEHVGKLETAPHFIGLTEKYEWDSRVPQYYSVETIWADTLLHAVSRMNRRDLVDNYFDEKMLIKHLLNNNRENIDEIMQYTNVSEQDKKDLFKTKKNNLIIMGRKIIGRINYIINNKKKVIFKKELYVEGCANIEIAVEYVMKFINDRDKVIFAQKR